MAYGGPWEPAVGDVHPTHREVFEEAIAILRLREWGPTEFGWLCPVCNKHRSVGHKADCRVAQFFLNAKEKVKFEKPKGQWK